MPRVLSTILILWPAEQLRIDQDEMLKTHNSMLKYARGYIITHLSQFLIGATQLVTEAWLKG